MTRQPSEATAISAEVVAEVRAALIGVARMQAPPNELSDALRTFCDEGHARGYLPEHLVLTLKDVWRRTHRPTFVALDEWDSMYETALTTMLRLYFQGKV